jgi:uncharacterized protein YceH (UPF0502 family)
MHHFEDLTEVQSSLQRLMQRNPALVRVLPRQPGTKESRYKHLLSGDTDDVAAEVAVTRASSSLRETADDDRLARLEDEVANLRKELADVKQQFATFRKQFE